MKSPRQYRDYIGLDGQLTTIGEDALVRLRAKIDDVLGDHNNNSLDVCRTDLDDHDCCYTCNDVEVAFRAYLEGILFDA